MITLRPYQERAISAILADWGQHTDVLLTMATGGGKTAVFLSVLHQVLGSDKRGLVIAHRKELIQQPVERLLSYYPEWFGRVGVVMAERDAPDAQLIVATVQTLASEKRLARILEHGPIDYLVTDEAHHATAETYLGVYEQLRAANPEMRHLGVTATPMRADGDGLRKVFQKESAHFGIVEMIQEGWLAPVRWLAIQTRISLSDVASRAGDYVVKQLSDVYEVDNCFDLVVATHAQYAAGRQAVAFTVSVEGAHRLAKKFNSAGVPAAAADASTPAKERAAILEDFQSGRTQVLCNVGLYTEGLDVPSASCIHQVRPTKSDGLYIQMVGRALRTFPGKADALVLDYAPLEVRNIAMMGDVLGCPLRKDAYVEQDVERGMVQAAFTFDGEFGWREGSAAEIVSRQLDYLDLSPWSWYRDEKNLMSLGLGESQDLDGHNHFIERTLVIVPPADGSEWVLYGVWRRYAMDGERKVITQNWTGKRIAAGEFAELQVKAEEIASKHGSAALAAKTRSWRKQPATEGQLKFALRLGLRRTDMSKGQMAQAITHALALSAMRGVL